MLEVLNITAGYGASTVLRDVSMSVPDGSTVALLGPNGAGKSTLLRTVSGFIRPMSGRVILDGHDVTGAQPSDIARQGLCLLPEGRGIFPSLSVRENLILQCAPSRSSSAIERAVTIFPALGSRLAQTAGSLSGGEQQMLALVRCYVAEPKLIVVDEASLGLSPIMVDRVFATFQELAGQGTSLLIVEQYVNRALQMSDSVCLINRGQILFTGPSSSISSDTVFEQYLGIDVGDD